MSLSSHKVMRPDNPRVTCDSPSRVRCRAARRARATACASTTETPRVRERARKDLRKTKRYIYVCVRNTAFIPYAVRYPYRVSVTPLACVRVSCCLRLYIIFIVCLTHTRAHTVLPLRFTAENQIVGWHCSGAHVPRDTRSARRRRYAVKGNAGPSTQAGGDLCAEPSINPAQLVRGASLTQ